MTIEEIVKVEADNSNTIILFREGIFWKAYERSAYAFYKTIKAFQIKKKFVKAVQCDIVSIGFPVSSTILQGKAILLEEERRMILSTEEIDPNHFEKWKKEQPLTITLGVTPEVNRKLECSSSEKEIVAKIRAFNVESKTPLECMLFLSDIKRQLSSSVF